MSSDDTITPPEKICSDHNLDEFDSGEPVLDDWLRRRALRNEASGASRTYVICSGGRVVGYYALAVGAVESASASGKVKRNMPDPVPVMVIARLAVDQNYQGRGLGRALIRDGVLRIVQAADIAGIRAILVNALSDDARKFYERCGFHVSPIDSMTLMITLADAKKALVDQ
ncbi:MAG: GNAT family N-acetyltransferase [Nitrospinota bacterium]|nr:GNAT family N-acetyltransferase [Nitrospinota bacterium]